MQFLRTCRICLRVHERHIGSKGGIPERQLSSRISAEPELRKRHGGHHESGSRKARDAIGLQTRQSFDSRPKFRTQFSGQKRFSSTLYTPLSEADHAPFVLKPEIDFERIFGDLGMLEENVKARGHEVNVSKLVSLWEKLQSLEQEKTCIEDRRSEVNEEIKRLRKRGGAKEQTDELQQMGRSLREELRQVNASIASFADEFYPMALKLPNNLHPDVPRGSTPKVLETFGDQPEVSMKPLEALPSEFLTESHPLAHAGFAYLEHDAALLELALTQWVQLELMAQGFVPFLCPAMYKPIALEALGIDPDSNEAYAVETHENVQYLAGVSPLAFTAYYMMSVIEAADLPYRCFAVGRSYNSRLESTHFEGLHKSVQTQKLELCGVCENTEAASGALFTQFLNLTRDLLSRLPLHYRIVEVPSACLLPSMYKKRAVEVWIPNAGEFAEVACVSSCTDYISRRVKMRYPAIPSQTAAQSRQRNFLHTVHCTALDTSVLLAALLPNIQQQFPEVLRPHLPQPVAPRGEAT